MSVTTNSNSYSLLKLYISPKLDEKLNLLSNVYSDEVIDLIDIIQIYATNKILDEFELDDNEKANLKVQIFKYLTMNMTDKEPKYSASDFYIARSDDGIFDMLMPFGLIIDYSMTHIGFMPECVDTSTDMQGVDGEIVQDSKYRSRIFDIFAVTQDGLSIKEKYEIKDKIAYILNSVKKNTKTITFSDSETSFDVKYSGLADITTDAPGWMRFELPLKSASSYGYKQFIKDLKGSGLITNDGHIEIGAEHIISGPCNNPSFILGDVEMKWNGNVPDGYSLVINTDNFTCYTINPNGEKENAMYNFNNKFKRIPVGSIVLKADKNTEGHIFTSWRELVLY